jgi:hypothetical protein
MSLRTVGESTGSKAGLVYPAKRGEVRIRPLVFDDFSAMEAWLEQRAIAALKKTKDLLTPEQYAKAVDDLTKRMAKGEFTAGGQTATEVMKTSAGMIFMLGLATGLGEVEVKKLLEDEGEEIVAFLKLQVKRSLPGDPAEPEPVSAENPEGNPAGGN